MCLLKKPAARSLVLWPETCLPCSGPFRTCLCSCRAKAQCLLCTNESRPDGAATALPCCPAVYGMESTVFDNNLWTQEAGNTTSGMNYGTLSPVLPVAWNPADISAAAAGAHHQQAVGDGSSFAVPPLKRWGRVHWSIAGAVQRKPGPAALDVAAPCGEIQRLQDDKKHPLQM